MKELKRRREERGWTLEDLRQATAHYGKPVSPAAISKIERGIHSPSVSTVERLAKALGCRAVDLVNPAKPHVDAAVGSSSRR